MSAASSLSPIVRRISFWAARIPELIGLRFHSATWGITYPDGRMIPADLLPIARTLRGQTVKGFQHLLVNHGSREKVLVSVTSMPIMNGAGEIIGSTAAMVELETSSGEGIDDLNGLWRGQWFAAATVPFWGLDAKGQIIDINNAALDAFDLTREQALGQNWTQFFVADGDFQKAIDYLGDRQDDASPHSQTSIHITLKASNGDTQVSVVTAWVVRTHEGGDSGLTVTALPPVFCPPPLRLLPLPMRLRNWRIIVWPRTPAPRSVSAPGSMMPRLTPSLKTPA